MPNKEDRPVETNNTPPYTFSDEVTKRKIRRHIKDITDVITEKDIKNAKVPGAEQAPLSISPNKAQKPKKNNVVDDVPGNPVTPWDVLSE